MHELETLQIVNRILEHGGFEPSFLDRLGFSAQKPVKIRHITMSEELQRSLDYPSKLSRQPSHIARLMEDGTRRGQAFLRELRGGEEIESRDNGASRESKGSVEHPTH